MAEKFNITGIDPTGITGGQVAIDTSATPPPPEPRMLTGAAPAPKPLLPPVTPGTSNRPSAIDDILARTDPRLGLIYRDAGFPDLPKFVSELGAGAIEGSTLGMLKAPEEAETTPQALLRGAGRMLGASFIPLGPVVRAAGAAGISKTLAGATANILATEVQTRGDADLSRLVLDGAFGALFGAMYKGGGAYAPSKAAGGIVAKEEGLLGKLETFRRVPSIESETSKTLRMAKETITTGKPRDTITTSYKQMAKFHKDPEIREYAQRVLRFRSEVPEGSIDVGALKKVWQDSASGAGASKPLGMEHGLEDLIHAETSGEPLLRQVATGISPLSHARPPKFVMADVQLKSGGRIKAYSDVFEPATAARRAASDEIGLVGKKVSESLRGVGRKRMEVMLQWLKSPVPQRENAAAALGLGADEQKKALEVADNIGALWKRNFNEDFNDYLTGVLPRLANASPQQLEALRNHRTAGQMLQYAAGAELRLDTKDLGRFAAGHIRALSLMHHFDPTYKRIAGMTLRGDLPVEYRDYIGKWLEGLRGTNTSFAKAYNPAFKKFLSSLGIDAADADVRNVVNTYVSLTHAGLLGFRPAPLIRNMFNVWQTGSRVGIGWTWKGIKMALTKEGREIARKGGMIEEEVLHEVTGLRELGQSGRIARFAEAAAEKGLRAYGKIDDFNRSAMYLGMREKFLKASRMAGRNEEKLLKRSGLYRFHPVIRDQILGSWRAGKAVEAAHLAGTHAAQDTQWVYRAGFRPTAMSGELNKAFLQFGVWPMNYFEYMRQMTRPLVGMDPHTPATEAAKWLGEWTLANAGILAAFGAAGSAVGLGPEAIHHTLGWTFAGPLSYTGGPLLDLAKSVEGWQPTASEGAAREARNSAVQAVTGAVPGLGLARDVARARGAGAEVLGEALGQGGMKAAGLDYPREMPAASAEQEFFKFMTGVRQRRGR